MQRRTFAVALAALAVVSLWAQETTAKKLSPDELKALIGGSEKFFFLDVREPKELEELGTIRGYVNIPLGEIEKRFSEVPKDTLVVVACNRAIRAAKAAAVLEKNGYKRLQLGALAEYKEKGYELIYPKAPQKPN